MVADADTQNSFYTLDTILTYRSEFWRREFQRYVLSKSENILSVCRLFSHSHRFPPGEFYKNSPASPLAGPGPGPAAPLHGDFKWASAYGIGRISTSVEMYAPSQYIIADEDQTITRSSHFCGGKRTKTWSISLEKIVLNLILCYTLSSCLFLDINLCLSPLYRRR